MAGARKITIQIEEEILQRALDATQEGITETIRCGLRLVAAKAAYQKATVLRGKYQIDLDVKTLRKD